VLRIIGNKDGSLAIVNALDTTYLWRSFPRFFRNVYGQLFYDATLSFSDKLARWRTQPVASRNW
jgi:hypothetical protein